MTEKVEVELSRLFMLRTQLQQMLAELESQLEPAPEPHSRKAKKEAHMQRYSASLTRRHARRISKELQD